VEQRFKRMERYTEAARALMERINRILGRPDVPPDRPWITGSRRELNTALGKTASYSDYLERLQALGELQLETRGGLFAIRLVDAEHHAAVATRLAEMRRRGV
jgi:hypothetical protein